LSVLTSHLDHLILIIVARNQEVICQLPETQMSIQIPASRATHFLQHHLHLRRHPEKHKRPPHAALKFVLFLTVLAFAALPTFAQTQVFPRWEATLNNFSPAAIASDSQGKVYLVGTAVGEMLTIKYDSDGHLLWKAWLGSTNQFPLGIDIGVDSAGNVYSLGVLNQEFATAKYNSSGVRQWVDYFSFPGGFIQPKNIAVKPDGQVFISGTSVENGTGASKALLLAYDTNGAQLWKKSAFHIGFDSNSFGTSIGVAADPQGNAVWGIYFDGNNQEYSSGITKYDAAGNQLATDAGGRLAELRNLKLDAKGDWYVTGTGDIGNLTGDAHPMAAKYDPSGKVIWFDDLGPLQFIFNFPTAQIAPNPDGSAFLSPVPGDSSTTLSKFSPAGVRLWTMQNSGLLASNSFGDVYIAGTNLSKYDPNGILIWQQPFASLSNQTASPTALTLAGGDVLLTGTIPANSANVTSSLTINYVQDAAKLIPSALTFPSQVVGIQSTAKPVVLKNTAEQSSAVTSITVDGDFHQTNNCPATLAPGATCTISITFLPTAAGTRTGTLTISDPWAGSPQTAKLTGTGTD
jgi:Abnormal spindle-like microcephaly-assoc'd, ASPM-SPD-2-Hydin